MTRGWWRDRVMLGGAVLLALLCGVCSCAPRGSSFETLGVPLAQERPGKGTIVLGWAGEHREGWAARHVRVDERPRREWTAETQAPAVIHLTPGPHSLRVYAALNSGTQTRRLKLRPLSIELAEGEVQLCVMDIGGERRRRPRVRCSHYLGPEPTPQESTDRNKRAVLDLPEPPPEPPPEPACDRCPGLEAVLERLARLEQRLEELARPTKTARGGSKTKGASRSRQKGFVPSLDIDTEYPLSSKKGSQSYSFDPNFDGRDGQGQPQRFRSHRFDPNFQDDSPTKTKR